MNKLLINFLEKHFVTSDAATIVNELEVVHPAAKMVVQAAKMQEEEYGDATNFVVVFAGELLSAAEGLLKMGLHTADIIKGYEAALEVATKSLKTLSCWKLQNPRDKAQLVTAIKTAVSSKLLGQEEHLAGLVAEAILKVVPEDASKLDLDNVRVARLGGGTLLDSHVIYGMVVGRDANGSEKVKKNCKVMVLGCPLELTGTETKGTVLLKSAEELTGFTKGEEEKMEEHIREIKDAGIDVLIANGTISDIAQHFCNKYEILTLRVPSKWDTRRICRTLGAQAMARLGAPLPEEIGRASLVEVREIGSHYVTVIEAADSKVATILLRGATANGLEEVERSIDDAASVAKAACKESNFCAGAGATEVELSLMVQAAGRSLTGLEQYAVIRFAEALECVPRILAENAGQLATDTVTALVAAHQSGKKTAGVNVEFSSGVSGVDGILDAVDHQIFDHLESKEWALRLATDAALTVLRVDQIIMSKPAGGPKPRADQPMDE